MAAKIRWSLSSVSDLEEICRFIARDSEYYARMFAQRILGVIDGVSFFPESGWIVP